MENIERALNCLKQIIENKVDLANVDVGTTLHRAFDEVEALKSSGIAVRHVTKFVVEGPARRRGRKAK
jgi:hypothetical protein